MLRGRREGEMRGRREGERDERKEGGRDERKEEGRADFGGDKREQQKNSFVQLPM